MGVGLAAAVAGGLLPRQPRVEPVLHVAAQDAVLDEDVPPRGHALVVHVEGAAAIGDGAVVHHGDLLGGHLLAEPARERRGALAVEVAFEAVAHRLVEEDARPARPEHHRHGAGGRVHRAQLEDGLAHRLSARSGASARSPDRS